MGVEILLFDNSVLKMHLLNSQLSFHIKSLIFSYFIFFPLANFLVEVGFYVMLININVDIISSSPGQRLCEPHEWCNC
jgi:hypothetical protein